MVAVPPDSVNQRRTASAGETTTTGADKQVKERAQTAAAGGDVTRTRRTVEHACAKFSRHYVSPSVNVTGGRNAKQSDEVKDETGITVTLAGYANIGVASHDINKVVYTAVGYVLL